MLKAASKTEHSPCQGWISVVLRAVHCTPSNYIPSAIVSNAYVAMAMSKIITWISALIIGWIIYAIYNSVHFLRILQYWKAPLRKPVLNLQAHGFAQATALFKSDLLSTLQLGHRTVSSWLRRQQWNSGLTTGQFPNSIYQLWTPIGYQIVLPRHFLDELKDLGEDFLSFNHYVQDVCLRSGAEF